LLAPNNSSVRLRRFHWLQSRQQQQLWQYGGHRQQAANGTRPDIRRGKVTTDFNGTTDIAYAVALQQEGKIVVVGTAYANNDYSNEDFAVTRYNANGTLDASFGVNGRVTTNFANLAAVASAVAIQSDGKIVVAGGAFPLFTFLGDYAIVRYNANGSLDSTFGRGGIVRTRFSAGGSYAFAVALQADGKIIAGGTVFVDFSTDDSSNTDFALVRYKPNGTLDSTFGNGGGVMTDFDGFNDDVQTLLIQPDGKIVAVGDAKNPAHYYDFALARYLPGGGLDTTFGAAGKVRTDFGASDLDIAYGAALNLMAKLSLLEGLRSIMAQNKISPSHATTQTEHSAPTSVWTAE
jgi:uncharacterized delta-60 repeat protein